MIGVGYPFQAAKEEPHSRAMVFFFPPTRNRRTFLAPCILPTLQKHGSARLFVTWTIVIRVGEPWRVEGEDACAGSRL
jgi:hypothetical protein